MIEIPKWWRKPRIINVLVDNESWILPFAQLLVDSINSSNDVATLCRKHDQIQKGTITFYLGCMQITPSEILVKNRYNLVVHESDLPRGRGFSPLTWLTLEGAKKIPVCLIEAVEEADAGKVIYRDNIYFEGYELIEDMRSVLGMKSIELCQRFLQEHLPPEGEIQQGDPTYYKRRYPKDSRLDPHKSIAEQFNLLRIVDNTRYPAYFEYAGHTYQLKIKRIQ